MKLTEKIEGLIKTTNEGWSLRKVGGLVGLYTAIHLSFKFSSDTNVYEIIVAWLVFILLSFSIVTLDQLSRFKNGTKEEKAETPPPTP
jgi:hypothetical protein